MRFPLRLTADLAISFITKTLRAAPPHRLILHLSPVAGSASPSRVREGSPQTSAKDLQLLSSDVCLDIVHRSSAPIVWIGGPEPLLHPEIGRLARRIVDTGRHVFVQTNGASLRRRIHEFRPVSRLFLTVCFNGFEQSHDRRARREGAFRDAVAGIRTAKLSGFLVCAPITVHADMELAEFEQLRAYLLARDVDGFVVTRTNNHPETLSQQDQNVALHGKLRDVRERLQIRRWQLFSRLVEPALHAAAATAPAAGELSRAATSAADPCEESVQVS